MIVLSFKRSNVQVKSKIEICLRDDFIIFDWKVTRVIMVLLSYKVFDYFFLMRTGGNVRETNLKPVETSLSLLSLRELVVA